MSSHRELILWYRTWWCSPFTHGPMEIHKTQTGLFIHWSTAAAAKSLQLCPILCNPIVGSPPGSPVPGILQARTLEWVAISFSNAWRWSQSEVAQSCLTLSNLMDCSLAGSSVHGIFQAKVLEWGAIAFFIVISRSIHIAENGFLSVLSNILSCIYTSSFYLLTCQWTFSWPPCFVYCK